MLLYTIAYYVIYSSKHTRKVPHFYRDVLYEASSGATNETKGQKQAMKIA